MGTATMLVLREASLVAGLISPVKLRYECGLMMNHSGSSLRPVLPRPSPGPFPAHATRQGNLRVTSGSRTLVALSHRVRGWRSQRSLTQTTSTPPNERMPFRCPIVAIGCRQPCIAAPLHGSEALMALSIDWRCSSLSVSSRLHPQSHVARQIRGSKALDRQEARGSSVSSPAQRSR